MLEGMVLTINGETVGEVKQITTSIDRTQTEDSVGAWHSFAKEYSGTFENVEFSDEFKVFFEYQKKLIQIEKKRQQLYKNKNSEKVLNMRKDMNNYLKKGRKW